MMAKPLKNLLEKMSPERQARIEARTEELLKEEMALAEIRRALNITQEQMANYLEIQQGSVSKMENQSDLFVSTLQRYIEAMGGELHIVVEIAGREVELNVLGNRKRSRKSETKKARGNQSTRHRRSVTA